MSRERGKTMRERRKRRRIAASEKLRIVLAGMQEGVEISELCRREGINPTMYYGWRKKLLSSAGEIFDGKGRNREEAEQERAAKELARMKEVVAEITAENLELKKGLLG